MNKETIAIQVQAVSKRYRSAKSLSLDGVSLSIPSGEVYGLLGPNGAGKTTLIRVITGVCTPTSGDVQVCGFSMTKDTLQAKKLIAVVTQGVSLNRTLSARVNIEFYLRFHGRSPRAARARTLEVLERLNLSTHADKKVGQLSGGLKRRVQLAQALASEARILILDEPTTGLDPHSRLEIWSIIEQLRQDLGTTVVISTQSMEEAEKLCTSLCLINQGRVAVAASVKDIRAHAGPPALHVTLAGMPPEGFEQDIALIPNVLTVQLRANTLLVHTYETNSVAAELLNYLARLGIQASTVAFETPSLENAYLALVAEGGEKVVP